MKVDKQSDSGRNIHLYQFKRANSAWIELGGVILREKMFISKFLW